MLLDLAVLAGLNGSDITVAIVADVVMVLTGLFGSLSEKRSTAWGWYTFACAAYLVIVYLLAVNGRLLLQELTPAHREWADLALDSLTVSGEPYLDASRLKEELGSAGFPWAAASMLLLLAWVLSQ